MITATMTVRAAALASADAERIFNVLNIDIESETLIVDIALRLGLAPRELLFALNQGSEAPPPPAACAIDL